MSEHTKEPQKAQKDNQDMEAQEIQRENLATNALAQAEKDLNEFLNTGKEETSLIVQAHRHVTDAIAIQKSSRLEEVIQKWMPLVYIVMAGIAQIGIIELYTRWHGSYFVSLDIYNPANIQILSKINFINNPPTTMDIIAEVLVWSSLGVWAKHTFDTPKLYKNQKPDFVHDIGDYIGKMIRNVTVASIIVILFRLSKISIFEVSLNDDNPFLFDAVVGISFILGVFGDDAYEILTGIKDRIVNSFKSK